MDDGSDQDYDSHIMVWQLPVVPLDSFREQQLSIQPPAAPQNPVDPPPATPPAETAAGEISRAQSIEPDETGLDAATYQRWNDQVESLLNTALEPKKSIMPEEVEASVEAAKMSSGSKESSPFSPSPKEDFTGGIKE